MRFTKFEIKKFKGIKEAIIDLDPPGANIFTLIGLNESGKTTILEALELFNKGEESPEALYKDGRTKSSDVNSFIPKHKLHNFSDEILIRAYIKFDKAEREEIMQQIEEEAKIKIIPDSFFPNHDVEIDVKYTFEDSKQKSVQKLCHPSSFRVILEGNDKITEITGDKTTKEIWDKAINILAKRIPRIMFFPTFLFKHPDKIILTHSQNSKDHVNKMYKQVIENIAKSTGAELDIGRHIVNRKLEEKKNPNNRDETIKATLNKMSEHLTSTIFGSWQEILGSEKVKSKKIQNVNAASARKIKLECDIDERGNVYVKFYIESGSDSYYLSEMSLGFQWFFSFLLFTFYMVNDSERPTLFLLDEPASNLHPQAQEKLLNSFQKVIRQANKPVQIIYSTHSHYLINPKWLGQAFIVSNPATDFENFDFSPNEINLVHRNEIKIDKCNNFIAQNQEKMTSFQPILDKLQVGPSRLEILQDKPIVLVEGKGDFFILEYGRTILMNSKNEYAIISAEGATNMDNLIALLSAWGLNFIVCLDGDKEGKTSKERYLLEWGFNEDKVFTLPEICDEDCVAKIENLLEQKDINIVNNYFGKVDKRERKKEKDRIRYFFSEHFAKGENVPGFSTKFQNRIKKFDEEVTKVLSKLKKKEDEGEKETQEVS